MKNTDVINLKCVTTSEGYFLFQINRQKTIEKIGIDVMNQVFDFSSAGDS